MHRALHGNEDTPYHENWRMKYPEGIIGWLVDRLPGAFQWSPLDVLRMEHEFPDIVLDIDHELWTRNHFRKELKENKKS